MEMVIGGEFDQKGDWRSLTAGEVKKIFEEIIPVGSTVLKEKATFIDGKRVDYEKGKALFFAHKLSGDEGENLELSWQESLFNNKRVGLEFEGEMNVSRQKISNREEAVLVSEERTSPSGGKTQIIRRFSLAK